MWVLEKFVILNLEHERYNLYLVIIKSYMGYGVLVIWCVVLKLMTALLEYIDLFWGGLSPPSMMWGGLQPPSPPLSAAYDSNHIELATQQRRKSAPLIQSTSHCDFNGTCVAPTLKNHPLALIHSFTRKYLHGDYHVNIFQASPKILFVPLAWRLKIVKALT